MTPAQTLLQDDSAYRVISNTDNRNPEALELVNEYLQANCNFLWDWADQGPDALEWVLREKTDIATVRTFALALRSVLVSAEKIEAERQNESDHITEHGELLMIKLQ